MYEKGCGIYMIKLLRTDEVYIGKSVSFYNRFKVHKYDLKKGKHANATLQAYYDKYGWEALEFSILLRCEKDELDDKENETTVTMHAVGHRLINQTIHTNTSILIVPVSMRDVISEIINLIDTGAIHIIEVKQWIAEVKVESEGRFKW